MKTFRLLACLAALQPMLLTAQPSLTIYNQNFALVRDHVPLDLKAGENVVPYTGVTAQVEPDSVVLRDPAGKTALRIYDQSYRADTLSMGYMLDLNEGKTIDFLVRDKDNKEYTVPGKIIRSGYNPVGDSNYSGNPRPGSNTPIIEVAGSLRFSLPGEPVFPKLGEDSVLKPTLTWRIGADAPAKLTAELSYLTGGLSWKAAYNLVAPEKSDTLDIVGWVTFENNSGKEFSNATVKLMAGNVNKIQPNQAYPMAMAAGRAMFKETSDAAVTEKAFDEFHLYSLTRPVSLHDRETKQVEFLSATNVKASTLYVYDGAALENFRGWDLMSIRNNPEYGTQSNKKVWVMKEFKNSKENGLGIALPAGRVRFYRSDGADSSVQFTGENNLEHTPEGETVRLYTGDAFDLVGERTRTDYQMDNRNSTLQEAFQIKVRNHKKEPVEIRVVEHLYRWSNWEIIEKSDDYTKTDSQTVEFRVTLKPDEEKVITYRVRYFWR